MTEINLLQNNTLGEPSSNKPQIANMIGYILLVVSVLAYAFFFVMIMKMQKDISNSNTTRAGIEKQIMANPVYPKLISNQIKIDDIKILLDKHLLWSELVPKFAAATLSTVKYNKFIANSDGTALITGVVPDFAELDRLVRGMQLEEFTYVKDVKLVNVGLSAEEQNALSFTIKVTFDETILGNQELSANQ